MSLIKALQGRKEDIEKQEQNIQDQIDELKQRIIQLEAAKLDVQSRFGPQKESIDKYLEKVEKAAEEG